ncbi:BREX-1 system adenine-specific DNA-methyltransferase PglX [Flavobacterium sp. Arc3]|uniref:BREX-1 system adenine-specific DNA-methyltransferase PglX n=1 Tax=Flavobacterium sp. Arc3 TaxID=3046686 RepID=UPI00352D638E
MNTNNIKSFAKQARLLLMEGVKQRLLYWGFDDQGNCTENLESTTGGYIFRTEVFNDDSVPAKWQKLKSKLTDKQSVQDTIEEAAYTWFNRLMAINILEKRGYVPATLAHVDGIKTPHIVQNAKRGNHQLKQQKYISLLQQYLMDEQEEQALGLLLTRLCNNNVLLHDVFGRIDDYTEILLPTNLLQRNGFIDLLNSDVITATEYKEAELIGWLYQFYIADKKDEVYKGFKSNIKARLEDIPAATQIFTPKWIVKYMVENTVGKIYLDYDTNSALKSEMKYFVENENTAEEQTASYILSSLEELTIVDPAAGSGHILVTGFDLLFKMYREQGYTAKNAVISILQNNIYGLDIDDRAMQLARFAVLLKAAEFYPEVLNITENGILLLPHIYSFPEAHHFQIEELQNFLTTQGAAFVAELKDALLLLNEGKNIGVALKFDLSSEAYTFITDQYTSWNDQYQAGTLDILQLDLWNNLKPFVAVLLVVTKKYTAVVANPPYMTQVNMNSQLKDYISKEYPETKSDLMTVFMEIIPYMTLDNSRFALINLPSWLFLSSFEKLRVSYIGNYHFESLLHMGRGIFGIDFGSVAFTMKKEQKENTFGNYFRLHERNFQHIHFEDIEKLFLYANGNVNYKYDFNLYRGDDGITEIPKEGTENGQRLFYPSIAQDNFEKIPGSPIGYWVSDKIVNLFDKERKVGDEFNSSNGVQTGKNEIYVRLWHEIEIAKKDKWKPYIKGGSFRKWYGNNNCVINWENNGQLIRLEKNSCTRGEEFYFKECVSWSDVTSGQLGARYYNEGFLFDASGPSSFPKNEISLFSVLGILNTKFANDIARLLNPTLHFQSGNFRNIPYIKQIGFNDDFKKISIHCSNISKKDWDARENSWDFEQSPLLNERGFLKDAYQKWQDDVTNEFFQLHENEEELNRIFIEIYGLQDELSPEVSLKDITILQEELNGKDLEQLESVFRSEGKNAVVLPIKKDEVISQFISFAIGVFMGRYRLDKPGLHIAHPQPTEDELGSYEVVLQGVKRTVTIDEDAIVPLMGSECAFPDDAFVRIKELVHDLWGEATLTENLNFINECLGTDLDKWLTEKLWGYHTSMYKKKPIYWLFCSNPKKPQASAFKVLVYMHRMDKYTISKIQRNYLHSHQEWIKQEIENAVANESSLSKSDLKRLDKLRIWELECRDYNETLKALALNEITFDLDDGVTVNYEKFEGAVAKI